MVNPENDLWIYFAAVATDGGHVIKIGKSRQPRGARLEQHRRTVSGEVSVELLCEVKAASSADETAVHNYFAHLRMNGRETFLPASDLVDYIRWLRDQYFVAVTEDTDDDRDSANLVEPDMWLPRPERRKPRDSSLLPGMRGLFDLGGRVVTPEDFYTNEEIVTRAREAMGGIDLDPASHPFANRVVQATQFYTKDTNGLAQPWRGRVWLNPPYGEWQEWAPKAIREVLAGRTTQLCVLVATRTLTAHCFHQLLSRCRLLCLFKGRLPFWGQRATTPDDGHAVLYFGDRVDAFTMAFRQMGEAFLRLR